MKKESYIPIGEREDSSSTRTSPAPSLLRLVAVAAATAATLGYDVGIMAAAIQPLEQEMSLTDIQKEVAMGSLNFVAAAGAVIGGHVANQRGRKPTVSVCCWLFVVGTLCMALAPHYTLLLMGRIITGLGVGVSFVVAPLYLSEVAPTDQRGRLNTVFDVAINGGILLGYVVGFCIQVIPYIPDTIKWRLMLGMGLLLPVIVLVFLALLPESPRWLVMDGQSLAARQVLEHLGMAQDEAVSTVESIEEELKCERQEEESKSWSSWFHGTRLAMGLGFWQQITGTEAVLYYSADFLARAGLSSVTQRLLGNCFVGLCKLVPELVVMRYVDRIGRRPLILTSSILLALTTGVLAMAFYFEWPPLAVVVLLCAVMTSFSVGLGPFSFLVASESLGLSERASGMTLCAATNRMTSGTVALTAVSLSNALGDAGFFALYAGIGVCSFFTFYYPKLPETSGQSLEEMAATRRGESATKSLNVQQRQSIVELENVSVIA